MTKADLIEAISHKHNLYRNESARLVDTLFELLETGLERGEPIKISGFGRFEVKQRSARLARNPHSGEAIVVDARKVLAFKPSEKLSNRLKGRSAAV